MRALRNLTIVALAVVNASCMAGESAPDKPAPGELAKSKQPLTVAPGNTRWWIKTGTDIESASADGVSLSLSSYTNTTVATVTGWTNPYFSCDRASAGNSYSPTRQGVREARIGTSGSSCYTACSVNSDCPSGHLCMTQPDYTAGDGVTTAVKRCAKTCTASSDCTSGGYNETCALPKTCSNNRAKLCNSSSDCGGNTCNTGTQYFCRSPVETTQYRLTATLVKYKLEPDGDYHVIAADESVSVAKNSGAMAACCSNTASNACGGSSDPIKIGQSCGSGKGTCSTTGCGATSKCSNDNSRVCTTDSDCVSPGTCTGSGVTGYGRPMCPKGYVSISGTCYRSVIGELPYGGGGADTSGNQYNTDATYDGVTYSYSAGTSPCSGTYGCNPNVTNHSAPPALADTGFCSVTVGTKCSFNSDCPSGEVCRLGPNWNQFLPGIIRARRKFDSQAELPWASSSWKVYTVDWTPKLRIRMQGFGYWDFDHDAAGSANNEFELHPVTTLCMFDSSSATTCALPGYCSNNKAKDCYASADCGTGNSCLGL